jgi:hypothetical protein
MRSRYIASSEDPIAPGTDGTIRAARGRDGALLTAIALVAVALAGCSSFNTGGDGPKPVDPNLFPADYKTDIMSFLQTDAAGLVGTREASLAPPELKPFGSESRYVSCLRVVAADTRRDKMIVFYGGQINQFIDASQGMCETAAYQPFPELPSLLAKLRSSRK